MTYYRNAKYRAQVDLEPFREFIVECEQDLENGNFDQFFGRDASDRLIRLRFSASIFTEAERTVQANQEPVKPEVAAMLAEADDLVMRAKVLSSVFLGRNKRKKQ